MIISSPVKNLIRQAASNGAGGLARLFTLGATIITPSEHIVAYFPRDYTCLSLYNINRTDGGGITLDIQPGVYFNKILPFKDNLKLELREMEGIKQRVRLFTLIPLQTNSPTSAGTSSHAVNMSGLDTTHLVSYQFQLVDMGYAILKNKEASDIHLMANLEEALKGSLLSNSVGVNLPEPDNFKGVEMETPLTNVRRYRQVDIPQGTRLIDLPTFLQEDPRYGLYNKGLGSYYIKGIWYIYPLYGLGRYNRAKFVLNVYRIPEDIMPTVENTYYLNEKSVTVLGLGKGQNIDNRDITRQNKGIGKRVMLADALNGDAGYYYAKSSAITTETDVMVGFKTAERGDGNEFIPLDLTPSNNYCHPMSMAAFNDGEIITVQWHNSDCSLLVPGMPVKYYYMKDDVIAIKEGTLLGRKTEYQIEKTDKNPVFREHTMLQLFLIDIEE
ncbi:hypothetical protein [Shewanella phage FishSpeaker]|nr:hypothetical protein [Shewanella phage FishSpeaker]